MSYYPVIHNSFCIYTMYVEMFQLISKYNL